MQRERIVWVDVMRGFSMLLVVLGHVLMVMGIEDHDTFLSRLLVSFRMPLFFFVSGYFSFRANEWWTKSRVKDILKRKFKAQILCTILFLSVYQFATQEGGGIFKGFGGYWFTIVLFQMYILFLISNLISNIVRKDITIPFLIILSIIGIALYAKNSIDSWAWNYFVWSKLANYLQYFTLGIICSKYHFKFFNLLTHNWFKTFIIIGWVMCMMLWYSSLFRTHFPLLFTANFNLSVRYFGLFCVIMVFYSNAKTLSEDNKLCRLLCFIGRRTLDIYMIHFFFLPNLRFLHPWVVDDFVLQLTVSFIFTIIITALCLVVSQILRQSNTLAIWLFGEKRRTPDLHKIS